MENNKIQKIIIFLKIIKQKEYWKIIKYKKKRAILKIIPDELSYWICTSDGSDKAKIQEMEKKYPDLGKLHVLQKIAFGEDHPSEYQE